MVNSHGFGSMTVGFIGGCVTMLNSESTHILSSVGGAMVVALALSFFSYIGKEAGAAVLKHANSKYKKYKNRKDAD